VELTGIGAGATPREEKLPIAREDLDSVVVEIGDVDAVLVNGNREWRVELTVAASWGAPASRQ